MGKIQMLISEEGCVTMAENTNAQKLAKARKGFTRFFKDIKAELKKVIWPTKKQLTNYTISVLFACLFVGALIWIADYGLSLLLALTLKK